MECVECKGAIRVMEDTQCELCDKTLCDTCVQFHLNYRHFLIDMENN